MTNDRSGNTVIHLADARAKLKGRSGGKISASAVTELEQITLLLDQAHSTEAKARALALLPALRNEPALAAEARLALSRSLEMLTEFGEALAAVAMYESADARNRLDAQLALKLRAQVALCYSYTGDHPRAIALLQAALKEIEKPEEESAGILYLTLAHVYRRINEYPIARGYSLKALDAYRTTGDWRGLAEAYFGIARADVDEGKYESALENYHQALQLVGDHPATFFLGKIYGNMAGACWFLRRPQEGIQYLEKAIDYYERTEHKTLAADAYNNLGMNLMLMGQWDRAQEALERASTIAAQVDSKAAKLPMILDSLAELHLLRGNLAEAREHLERAVTLAQEAGNKWYECQALRTLARCFIAMDFDEAALETAHRARALAQRIGDRQAIHEAQLLIAETALKQGDLGATADNLSPVVEETADSAADLGLAGEAQRLLGLLEMARSDPAAAAQHFGRSASIFDLLGDRYRSARAHYKLGQAYSVDQPELAIDHLTRAINTFRELGATIDLQQAERTLRNCEESPPQQARRRDAALQLITLRLAEAVASRGLLLRELAAVIRQETGAARIAVLEADEERHDKVLVAHGYEPSELAKITEALLTSADDEAIARFTRAHDTAVINLRSHNSLPATLLISPRERAVFAGGLALDPLLRVVELGMDVCALRARAATTERGQEEDASAGSSLMPGFIHSSPAMAALVEEVNKIRSSDVTVLVTGESGTGKELVARAIHALSSRRDKIFVPFNCTAVPKELSESYLFGHKRGAFTGAVSDSVGVIRSAAGGTLFIDEIGDLPLDVQPKLLRFLQEGEIQPLGEQQPIHIDVRIIAATNTDLEEMVAQGRFREDLYYRLNVIRLRVPPLRERRSEIPTIVNYYINHYSSKFGRHDIQITPPTVDLLMVADWPGNVRQLCNEIQRIVARAENGTLITPEHLSPELRQIGVPIAPPSALNVLGTANSGRSEVVPIENVTLAEALEQVERRMITEALRKHRGNISRAARELGLTRRGLYLKLERYQIGDELHAETAKA